MRRIIWATLASAGVLLGCQAIPLDEHADATPLFEGMGPHTRKVTTSDPMAQRYFDQGLTWAFAFNHDEAIRSFEAALRHDPACAMAYWGIALSHGPHINNPAMDEARSKAAWEALKKAEALKDQASPVERALIEALAARYADPSAGTLPLSPEERAPLDRAYADAMAKVWRAYPDDDDVGTLYAEALMDLLPWDLWSLEGEPRPETPEVLRTLERVLSLNPDHPGANHLYIHVCEASPHPEKAMAAADRLRTLVPASGHLVHMPGHIDVRVGRWAQAAEQNRQAIKIDREYRKISPKQGFYNIYMAHDHQFLSWACMMLGRSEESIAAARDMVRSVPMSFIEESAAAIDGYMHIEIEALQRFGKWDELLAMPAPPKVLPITTAFWRYARGTALAAKGKIEEARREQALFREAVKAVPKGAIMAINDAHETLAIAEHFLEGEIAYRNGDLERAISELRKAVEIEDRQRYMEPPDWLWPARHTLGAFLMEAGRYSEAEAVYREDLKRWPENGWSLYGLAECLKKRNAPEAAEVEARFKKVWAGADIDLGATCLCVERDG